MMPAEFAAKKLAPKRVSFMRERHLVASRIFRAITVLLAFACLTSAEQLPVKSYTVADGLAHGTITSIYQDRKGYLWFCTFEGLSLFDGYRFKNYDQHDGLPPGVVNSVTEDREG